MEEEHLIVQSLRREWLTLANDACVNKSDNQIVEQFKQALSKRKELLNVKTQIRSELYGRSVLA